MITIQKFTPKRAQKQREYLSNTTEPIPHIITKHIKLLSQPLIKYLLFIKYWIVGQVGKFMNMVNNEALIISIFSY